jgi:hypothetical protein
MFVCSHDSTREPLYGLFLKCGTEDATAVCPKIVIFNLLQRKGQHGGRTNWWGWIDISATYKRLYNDVGLSIFAEYTTFAQRFFVLKNKNGDCMKQEKLTSQILDIVTTRIWVHFATTNQNRHLSFYNTLTLGTRKRDRGWSVGHCYYLSIKSCNVDCTQEDVRVSFRKKYTQPHRPCRTEEGLQPPRAPLLFGGFPLLKAENKSVWTDRGTCSTSRGLAQAEESKPSPFDYVKACHAAGATWYSSTTTSMRHIAWPYRRDSSSPVGFTLITLLQDSRPCGLQLIVKSSRCVWLLTVTDHNCYSVSK